MQSALAHLAMSATRSQLAGQLAVLRLDSGSLGSDDVSISIQIHLVTIFSLQANVVGFSRFRRSLNPYFLLFPED